MTRQMTRRAMLAATAGAALALATPMTGLADEDQTVTEEDAGDEVVDADGSVDFEGGAQPIYYRMRFDDVVDASDGRDWDWMYLATDAAGGTSLLLELTNKDSVQLTFSASIDYVHVDGTLGADGNVVWVKESSEGEKTGRSGYYRQGDLIFGQCYPAHSIPSSHHSEDAEYSELGSRVVKPGETGTLKLTGIPSDLGKVKWHQWGSSKKMDVKALIVGVRRSNSAAGMGSNLYTYTATWANAMYRLYNPYTGEHHYTMSAVERDSLVAAGWKSEGVGWYSDDAQGVPLYRGYNPYVTVGTHHYTTSKVEMENMVANGWRDEKKAWYGLKTD